MAMCTVWQPILAIFACVSCVCRLSSVQVPGDPSPESRVLEISGDHISTVSHCPIEFLGVFSNSKLCSFEWYQRISYHSFYQWSMHNGTQSPLPHRYWKPTIQTPVLRPCRRPRGGRPRLTRHAALSFTLSLIVAVPVVRSQIDTPLTIMRISVAVQLLELGC